MNVRKFIAANARDALRKVKETLGNDAIILSNRGVPGGVEIMAVAARDMAMIVPTPVPHEAAPRIDKAAVGAEGDDYSVMLTSARAQMRTPQQNPAVNRPPANNLSAQQRQSGSVNAGIPRNAALRNLAEGNVKPAIAPAQPQRPVAQTPSPTASKPLPKQEASMREAMKRAEAEVIPMAVMDEIRSLRKIVEQHLAGIAWGEAARAQPAKTELMRQMLDAGFSPQFSRDLLAELPPEMDAVQALAWVRGAADRSLKVAGGGSDIVDQGGVYALVGPTGVGKTTTTAKLAARCVLRHGPSKVALVTTDSYRIGAHEQLRIYGRILGVPVYLVKDGEELRQTLRELQHKHLVLIDTMGMSQRDKLVPELTDMLAGCAVQRLLLLSSTSRGDTMDDVIRAYAGDSLAGCVLTKIDEAASLATALDVIMRHRLTLHYVSNGQRVPEDLHLPNRAYLLHRAFKDSPEDSAHRFTGAEPALMMAGSGMLAAGGQRG